MKMSTSKPSNVAYLNAARIGCASVVRGYGASLASVRSARMMDKYAHELRLIERAQDADEIGGAMAVVFGKAVDVYRDGRGYFATLGMDGYYVSAVELSDNAAADVLTRAHEYGECDAARMRTLIDGIQWGRRIPSAIAPRSWIED